MRLPLALTMGEPSGICGELTLKAWLKSKSQSLTCFYVIGDLEYYQEQSTLQGQKVDCVEISNPADAIDIFPDALPILPLKLPAKPVLGQLNPANSQCVIKSISMAVAHVQDGVAAGVVTNPIHKAALYDIGFKHPGHTEYLAELAGGSAKSVMMLACDDLRVVPVTIHLSLLDAIQSLGTEEIVNIGKITAKALKDNFAIQNPRLGMAALNPHAGEDGAMGCEEITIIQPAVDKLRASGINVSDPLPADTLFHEQARKNWDAVICMYHDQALIPLKTIDFSGGVNITLGLPFIRTSPDHGTALDIAGKGIADAESLINALKQATKMSKHHG